MSMTDPVADMLVRIKNGYKARHRKVDVPASRVKHEIAKILLSEGFIEEFNVIEDSRQNLIRILLKYDEQERPALTGMRRISRPGLRKYTDAGRLPRVMGGLGIAIVSTSRGVMTDSKARKERVGGEIICYVW
jgi:small subunit ribosomal protein S8